ncbi:hypothetical protein EMUCRT_0555 [Ehrlichia cf. muris str. EmCRT]|uniref:Uncharacterized protein n=1 Tax=Ehrlichia cf. muris str. EmCRT TaxID=1359167 RepID=A0A0F3NC65_9RICK|nr:hypothetical protein EMUCRT_0555 [Ehrlichia cf. muris str. EmCRT]
MHNSNNAAVRYIDSSFGIMLLVVLLVTGILAVALMELLVDTLSDVGIFFLI